MSVEITNNSDVGDNTAPVGKFSVRKRNFDALSGPIWSGNHVRHVVNIEDYEDYEEYGKLLENALDSVRLSYYGPVREKAKPTELSDADVARIFAEADAADATE